MRREEGEGREMRSGRQTGPTEQAKISGSYPKCVEKELEGFMFTKEYS